MKAAFTPAPWRLRIDPYEDDPFPGKDFFSLRLGEGDDEDILTGITAPANARLIAAAPELYGAVERALRHAQNLGIDSEGSSYVNQLRAALAKALGEQA